MRRGADVKCYYHAERDAVGLCGACHRGICADCARDMQRGLACRGRCEHEVRRLLDLRDFSFTQPHQAETVLRASAGAQVRSSIFLIMLGVIMVVYGLYNRRLTFLLWLGGVELVFGAVNLWRVLTRKPAGHRQFRLCAKCGYNVTGNTTGRCPECNFQV